MEDFPYIAEFFDASTSGANKALMWVPDNDVPEEMRVDGEPAPSRGYVAWKLIRSTVTDDDLDGLERAYGIRYPPIYRAFLKSYHFYDLAEFGVRFFRHILHRWEQDLRNVYDMEIHRSLLAQGLIPIGSEAFMDAGTVCFDTRQTQPNGDCPVIYWDHAWRGTEKECCPLFSSGELMFAALAFAAYANGNFAYHDACEDDPSTLPLKKKKMTVFLDIDPEGAGGVARDHWTRWGVNPDS